MKIVQCRYFRNNILCPFEELGCKFWHDADIQVNDASDTSEIASDHSSVVTSNSGRTEDSSENFGFCTSTPEKLGNSKITNIKKLKCENCPDQTQCADCFVSEYIQKQRKKNATNKFFN